MGRYTHFSHLYFGTFVHQGFSHKWSSQKGALIIRSTQDVFIPFLSLFMEILTWLAPQQRKNMFLDVKENIKLTFQDYLFGGTYNT